MPGYTANMASLRADSLRRDLRDEDATAYVWTDAVLNRHLQHALDELQRWAPRVTYADRVVPNPSTQRLDLSTTVGATFLYLLALEYPTDQYPPATIPFREEDGPKAYLLQSTLPTAGSTLRVWYAAAYTLNDASSDVPADLTEALLAGGLLFALTDQSIDITNRLSVGPAAADYRAIRRSAESTWRTELASLTNRPLAAPTFRPAWRTRPDGSAF